MCSSVFGSDTVKGNKKYIVGVSAGAAWFGEKKKVDYVSKWLLGLDITLYNYGIEHWLDNGRN